MTKLLLALGLCLSASFLAAQNCEPDLSYADSTAGVYPKPYEPDINPNGGITECAVINQAFEFTLTIVINDTLTYQGLSFPLDSIIVSQVNGLPVGMSYACEPPNCHFLQNTIGCAKIFGTPTNANAPGDYDLVITGSAFINGSNFPIPISFPDAALAPGKYTIHLNASASDPCNLTSTTDLHHQLKLLTLPNPTSGMTRIQINSKINGQFHLRVVDLLGQTVQQLPVNLSTGENTLDFDASALHTGMYLLQVQNESGLISQKLLVQH